MTLRILLVRSEGAWGREAERVFLKGVERSGRAQVLFASCAEEAIVQAAEEPIDLAVADLVLPGPGALGAYTLVRLGELCPDCRMIVVSDHEYVGGLLGEVADIFVVREENPQTSELGGQLLRSAEELLEGLGKVSRPMGGENVQSSRPTQIESSRGFAQKNPSPPAAAREESQRAERGTGRLIAGKYRLESKLGQGGMGEVFRAEDVFIQRPVAIKLLRLQSSSGGDVGLLQRMHREVMIAGRLTHPHIVTVYDAGFDGERMYLVMALVDGKTLRDRIEEPEILPRGEVIDITLQILDALLYAHRRGVIHRDLKPSNVLMGKDGTVQVADFGLAKIRAWAAEEGDVPPSAALQELTADGMVLGTVGYMAPEQMIGRPSDPRSDLYSLGAILFEMLHGKALSKVISPIRTAACFRMGKDSPELPPLPGEPELDRILQRALAIPFEDRYPSSEALAEALRSLGV